MESLLENKALLYSLTASAGAIMMLTTGISTDFCNQFEIVPMPDKVGLIYSGVCFRD
jgi:hypothetical protein